MKLPPKPYVLNTVIPHTVANTAPPVYRPKMSVAATAPTIVLPQWKPVQLQQNPVFSPAMTGMHSPKPYSVVQPKSAGAGQPRFYPNLNPAAAALKVDPSEFM